MWVPHPEPVLLGWERGIPHRRVPFSLHMELLHHQAMMRDTDGVFVCSRCGMVNPTEDQPCIPVNLEPADERTEAA
jgi:hypothetical protein